MEYALPHTVHPAFIMISLADVDSITKVANSVSFTVPRLRSLMRLLDGKLA
jgi:hypothetical protein